MFNSSIYKKNALSQLKNRWKIPVIFSIVSALLLLCFSSSRKMQASISNFFSLVSILILGIIIITNSYFYLKLTRTNEKMTFNDILIGIGEYWQKGILGFLWFLLWTWLWSLLFIIPGIVKAISYSQMFFLLAEHPDMGVKKAMNISKILTNGHKSDLFLMQLSFIGWEFLASLTFGIGNFWLIPYMNTAFANAYTDLKLEALNSGKLKPSDFLEEKIY